MSDVEKIKEEEIVLINLPENLIEKAIAELKVSEIPVFIIGGGANGRQGLAVYD